MPIFSVVLLSDRMASVEYPVGCRLRWGRARAPIQPFPHCEQTQDVVVGVVVGVVGKFGPKSANIGQSLIGFLAKCGLRHRPKSGR